MSLDEAQARRIYAAIRELLSPFDSYLLETLIIREESVEEIARETGLSTEELERRKSQILEMIRAIAAKVDGDH